MSCQEQCGSHEENTTNMNENNVQFSPNYKCGTLDMQTTKCANANVDNNNTLAINSKVIAGECEISCVRTRNSVDDSDHSEVSNNGKADEVGHDISPSHHARRPMNAFLIFCKKHRPIIRKKFPTLENRGITRILGEWWSLLDYKDKNPYTILAKQYKDAFFTANPDFKWYKLPAPPLRTWPIRTPKIEQLPPYNGTSSNLTNSSSTANDFTPGKLADESQLGLLSALLVNNNVNVQSERLSKQTENDDMSDNNVQDTTANDDTVNYNNNEDYNVEGHKVSRVGNSRKSGRKSKGNRYADMMANGKLIKNKRSKFHHTLNSTEFVTSGNKMELSTTIKRLQARLSNGTMNNNGENSGNKLESRDNNLQTPTSGNDSKSDFLQRVRTISEISEVSDVADYSRAIPSFDLEMRISDLPLLSYESYIQCKQEMKKRKYQKGDKMRRKKRSDLNKQGEFGKQRSATAMSQNLDTAKVHSRIPPRALEKEIGSKKRKNKHNITHFEHIRVSNTFVDDLSGLNTLAEIASTLSTNRVSECNATKDEDVR